ncbi:hypothetical protein D3C73_1105070 [compost metagenome]
MTDRFVQQHARPACTQHDRQCACWRGYRGEIHQRHAHGFFRPCIGTDFAVKGGEEIVIAKTTTTAASATFTLTVIFNLHANGQAHQRTNISRQRTVSRRNQNQLINAGQASGHFLHTFVGGTRDLINATQNIQLLFTAHALQRIK